jgi:hypothetical protein
MMLVLLLFQTAAFMLARRYERIGPQFSTHGLKGATR